MTRVLRPEGVLVAFDNDWETLTVDSTDRKLTRAVVNAWEHMRVEVDHSGRIGLP